MAIEFYNEQTGEQRTAETDEQITALWSSGDHSPNITQGQDFGWRLAPEVLLELNDIKRNPTLVLTIAQMNQIALNDVKDHHILAYISAKSAPVAEDAPDVIEENRRAYQEAVRKAEAKRAKEAKQNAA